MKNELKAFRQNLVAREQAISEAKHQIEELQQKHVDVSDKLPKLRGLTASAAKSKLEVMDLFVLGKASQSELDKARTAYSEAKKEEEQAEEILTSITRNQERITQSIPKLMEALRGANHELWQHVMKMLRAEIPPAASILIEKAWCAALESGAAGSYEFFLRALSPQPSIERIRELRNKLKQDFGIEENV